MTELIKKSLVFIRKNPRIIYSLVLIFFIPLAIYFNTNLTINLFKENLDQVIQSRATIAEDIAKFIVRDAVDNPSRLNELVNETKNLNKEIGTFEILNFDKASDSFRIIASSDSENIGQELRDFGQTLYYRTSWNQPDDNVNFTTVDGNSRSWNVLEAIKNNQGEPIALVRLSFPLEEFDKINSRAEIMSYGILTATIIIVLLLVASNARLFGYALTLSKLKEIDKMKDDFISMASHELRTPLVAIKGYLDFLKEKNQTLDKESQGYIDNITASTSRLDLLVNDILEVSRIEGNRIPINISEVNPEDLIAKTIEELKPQAYQKKLGLTYSPQTLPSIKADPERVKQILINLIGNAIKYTLQGEVKVLTKITGRELAITIADTGVGLSAENQKNLFQKFQRIYNEKTKNVTGTGLGLWITGELARKMGGDITVESIEGVGSHFTVHLPLAK